MKIGPKFKIARRLGARVFPKTQTTKFSISGSPDRGRGGRRPRASSEYGTQLIEKQKLRYTYGLKEHQLARYVAAARERAGDPSLNLFQTLERRLDNVVFRLGLANSRAAARQLVTHGHITLNGRRLNIPSHQVRIGDQVAIRTQSQSRIVFNGLADKLKDYTSPAWLSFSLDEKRGEVIASPLASDFPPDIGLAVILEFYSRV